jgi:hypothetical protein
MLAGRALLVLDRVVLAHAALAEQRFHTRARLQTWRASAVVEGEKERLHLAFTASVPARLKRGLGLPTHPPRDPDSILRWVSEGKHREILMATLMTPKGVGRLTLNPARRVLRAQGPGFAVAIHYQPDSSRLW